MTTIPPRYDCATCRRTVPVVETQVDQFGDRRHVGTAHDGSHYSHRVTEVKA